MEKRLVSFRLPERLLEELKLKAQADGVSVTELVCRFSQQGLQATTGVSAGREVVSVSGDVDTKVRLARLEERIERLTQLENRFDTMLVNFLSNAMSKELQQQFQGKP